MAEWIVSVSDLNEYVQRTLQADPTLRSIRLRGEVSNFKAYASGHWYFSLKDERCTIGAVMFRQNALRMSLRPRDGMAVVVTGQVTLYPESGKYQIVCENMRPDGVGSLYQQFEALKRKLQLEGLFDASRKQALPWRPRRIAVVTSPSGAVLHDIRKVSAQRDPGVPLVLLPVQVQGQGAAEEIASAIRRAGALPGVDVIITGRGGGSMEDLWAFNEEAVARAIAESPIPVISAVGHETDTTIADFVADVRASTPSNAAELAVPDRREIIEGLRDIRRHMDNAVDGLLQDHRYGLMTLRHRLANLSPERQLSVLLSRGASARNRLDAAVDARLTGLANRIPMADLRLHNAVDRQVRQHAERIEKAKARLTALNPAAVLERGYALVMDVDKVVASVKNAPEHMQLRLRDGTIRVKQEWEE